MTDNDIRYFGRDLIELIDVKSARDVLLSSDMFKHSPRMSRLLNYLVEQAIVESVRDTSEYAIGISVFDRDPCSYSTGEDPVVRVQVGRLRAKLRNYYATFGRNAKVRIVIPLGCYMPTFQRQSVNATGVAPSHAFCICPFKCLSSQTRWECFTEGLHEELTHHLYKKLDRKIIVESAATCAGIHPAQSLDSVPCNGIGHRLEGSVHVDAERIRTSVRLIDVTTGYVAWSEQFNRAAYTAIAHQQELASSICYALQGFLAMHASILSEHSAHNSGTALL